MVRGIMDAKRSTVKGERALFDGYFIGKRADLEPFGSALPFESTAAKTLKEKWPFAWFDRRAFELDTETGKSKNMTRKISMWLFQTETGGSDGREKENRVDRPGEDGKPHGKEPYQGRLWFDSL